MKESAHAQNTSASAGATRAVGPVECGQAQINSLVFLSGRFLIL